MSRVWRGLWEVEGVVGGEGEEGVVGAERWQH